MTEQTKYILAPNTVSFEEVPIGAEFMDSCAHMCKKTAKDSGYVYPLDDYMLFAPNEGCFRIHQKIVTTTYDL